MMPILEIAQASIRYGSKALFEHLDLKIDAGEAVCLTGISGSGKTSLLRAVAGFTPLSEGHITVDNLELNTSTIDSIRRKISYLPQELYLPVERVSEMVQMIFSLKANIATPFDKQRLFAEWEELALDTKLYDQHVAKISGGQRQRIMLSVCLMTQKPLI